MNEIYQQKMERYSEEYVFENCEKEREVFLVKDAYQKGWCNALQNQWISVEEALPEENGIYFVLINSKAPHITTFTDKWNIGNNTYNITHWMKIPSLKGGEK